MNFCRLHRTYRDAQRVYMLMECCIGGEMYTIIRDRGRLDEPSSRYYCAAIIEALEYLHCRSIVYRDLKPENVLLQKDGIPKLVDFGFAKRLDEDDGRTWTFCGTAEYIAPEIVLNKGHDIAVDLWALGVFMYELLTGSPPFLCSDTMSTYNAILRGIESLVWPKYLSQDAITLIFNLCRKEPHQRLGYNRMQDVREASWYSMFDFEAFRSLKMKPPIIPNVSCSRSNVEFLPHISYNSPFLIDFDEQIRSDADTRNFEHFPVLDRFAIGRETSGWDRDF
ncbi:unnamed protein product [Anisakis simplex]|uniref:Protein kinase domain-containing protein n=1 Tax=Anisakis simplex TaxID=6269 RepID=A0A3P6RLE1_ANISI|nr:unnamed protein product [Anisakis simplex]